MDLPNDSHRSAPSAETRAKSKKRAEAKKEKKKENKAKKLKARYPENPERKPVVGMDSEPQQPLPEFHANLVIRTLPSANGPSKPAPAIKNNTSKPNPSQRRPFYWDKRWEWVEADLKDVIFWRMVQFHRQKEGHAPISLGNIEIPKYTETSAKDLSVRVMPAEIRYKRHLRKGQVMEQDPEVMKLPLGAGKWEQEPILDTSRMTAADDHLMAAMNELFGDMELE